MQIFSRKIKVLNPSIIIQLSNCVRTRVLSNLKGTFDPFYRGCLLDYPDKCSRIFFTWVVPSVRAEMANKLEYVLVMPASASAFALCAA